MFYTTLITSETCVNNAWQNNITAHDVHIYSYVLLLDVNLSAGPIADYIAMLSMPIITAVCSYTM